MTRSILLMLLLLAGGVTLVLADQPRSRDVQRCILPGCIAHR